MIYIRYQTTDICKPYPLPAFRNVEWDFVGGDFGEGFFLFEFAGADEGLLFGLDLLVELFAGALFGVLFDEFALNGQLEDRFLHVRREALIEVLQAAPRLLLPVHIQHQLYISSILVEPDRKWRAFRRFLSQMDRE